MTPRPIVVFPEMNGATTKALSDLLADEGYIVLFGSKTQEPKMLGNELRPCEVTSHQFSMEGLFHRFIVYEDKNLALVELKDGTVNEYDLSYNHIKFTDRE